MTQDSKNLIKNFLIEGFSIKKIKNNSDKWTRVICITEGYIRSYEKSYKWSQGIDSELAVADLIELITKVFACSQQESMIIVMDFIKTCPVLNTVHKKSNRTPLKKVLPSTKKGVAWFGKPKKY